VTIDAFAHLYPRDYLAFVQKAGAPLPLFVQSTPTYTDGATRLEELDRHRIERQVLALGTPAFDEIFTADRLAEAETAARIANDGLAVLAAQYPDRFVGVATLPLVGPASIDLALQELDRAIGQLHLRGVQLYATHAGIPLDHPAMRPLYERVVAYGVPILLHPSHGFYRDLTHDYLLWLTFGWPFETTLAMARLVYSGLLEDFPQIKILTHHLGAFVPSMAERIKGVTATLERTSTWRLPRPVLSYFRRFYGDTAVNGHQPALAAGYEFFGPEHIVYGSDYPFVPIGVSLEAVRDWKLPGDERAGILAGNARRLFGV
jgi:predicted TIM-barrel fold metal-dependent hydrolase